MKFLRWLLFPYLEPKPEPNPPRRASRAHLRQRELGVVMDSGLRVYPKLMEGVEGTWDSVRCRFPAEGLIVGHAEDGKINRFPGGGVITLGGDIVVRGTRLHGVAA